MSNEEPALSRQFSDPLDFLLAVMNDESAEVAHRLEAASALMPYFHESLRDPAEEDQDD